MHLRVTLYQGITDMLWIPLPSLYPEIQVWGCTRGLYQYVVSWDTAHKIAHASMKGMPNLGKRVDLGDFALIEDAKKVCESHSKGGS
jgi:hypothetical protein